MKKYWSSERYQERLDKQRDTVKEHTLTAEETNVTYMRRAKVRSDNNTGVRGVTRKVTSILRQ